MAVGPHPRDTIDERARCQHQVVGRQIGAQCALGLAYVFIALMVVTSFDHMAAWLGPRLQLTGMWHIWLSFALNFGKRIARDGMYALPVALIVLAALLRLAAWHRRCASGSAHAITADALQGCGPA